MRRTTATQNKLPLQDEVLTPSQVPANQETRSESSDSVTEIAYFPPLPERDSAKNTSTANNEDTPAMTELEGEAQKQQNKIKKIFERQPTVWEQN